MLRIVRELCPDLIVHAAAQPSHDSAAKRPFDDFDVNAVGTLSLLEATRQGAPDVVLIDISTNKVHGAAPNRGPLVELETRREYVRFFRWYSQYTCLEGVRIMRISHARAGIRPKIYEAAITVILRLDLQREAGAGRYPCDASLACVP